MIAHWFYRLRRRAADELNALERIQGRARSDVLAAFADYDAFVAEAERARDGLIIGTAVASDGRELPIVLPWGQEYLHGFVQGSPGTGKTTWLASLMRQALVADRPVGVIDCKADLFAEAVRSAAVLGNQLPPERRQAFRNRLVVINPFTQRLVPLNVCAPLPGISAEAQAYEVTLALSRLFDSGLSLHMESLMRHLLLLLAEFRLTLVEAPLLLQDDVVRGVLAMRSTHSVVREFFLRGWETVPQVSKDALLVRLQSLFLSESCRLMLGADALVDLRGILDRGDPMFVFLGRGPGIPEEQVEILGSLFFQLMLQAVYARGSTNPPRYPIVLDEFAHLLAAPALARRFETALTTVRSFGLSLLLCHHSFGQLPATLRETMLANCDVVALFRTSARNAAVLGDFLPDIEAGDNLDDEHRRERGRLERVERLPERHFYWYDRRKRYRAIKLRADEVPAAHRLGRLSSAELNHVIRDEGWDQGGVAVSRDDLQVQIAARHRRLRDLCRPSSPQRPGPRRGTSGAPELG